jgi:hypothetical protein
MEMDSDNNSADDVYENPAETTEIDTSTHINDYSTILAFDWCNGTIKSYAEG